MAEKPELELGDTLAASDEPRPAAVPASAGAVIGGRYEVIRLIASGGMGEVYEAQDCELNERVALKRIRGAGVTSPVAIERFKREIQLARKVTHPNVCRIHDLGIHRVPGSDEQEVFLSMELLLGETLAERIRRDGKLGIAAAWPIVEQLGAGLGAAHAAGIVHRDFKSQNVILVGARAVVTDFGLARPGRDDVGAASITGTGDGMIGTPGYMAPEQVLGDEVTAAADIYAFGVVMYEMVTGRLPFIGENALATAAKRLSETAKPPGVDPKWDAVIMRCLAREPGDRFGSIADVIAALSPAKSRRRIIAIAGAGFVTVGAIATVALLHSPASTRSAHASGMRNVAVVGFRNTTGTADAAWISTGLVQMLSTELSSGELHAVASESVARARSDLALPEADSYASDTLGRIRANTGADYVLVGSYVDSGGKLRIDLHLQDTASGQTVASVSETTTDAELVDAVPALAARVRNALGVTAQAAASSGVSRDPEAARLYAEGVDRRRNFDLRGARDLLSRSISRDPQAPMAHHELSRVLASLEYDRDMKRQAADEAHAAQLLSKDLPENERLVIEANYHELNDELDAAIAGYRTLAARFPDDVDAGEALIRTFQAAHRPDDAHAALAALRARPALADDPRLDAIEAQLARDLDNRVAERDALDRGIPRARTRGARRLLAGMLVERAWITANTGKDPEVGHAAAVEAEKIARDLGDQERLAEALHVEITSSGTIADSEHSLQKLEEIERIDEAVGNQRRAIDTLSDGVFIAISVGQIDDALRRVQRMKELAATAGVRMGRAASLELWALTERGEVTKAQEALARDEELVAKLPSEGPVSAFHRAAIDLDAGRVDAARPVLATLSVDHPGADASATWMASWDLYQLAIDEGRGDAAVSLGRKFAAMFSAGDESDFGFLGRIMLLRALATAHHLDEARELYGKIATRLAPLEASELWGMYVSAALLAYHQAIGDSAAAATDADALSRHIAGVRGLGAIRRADECELALARWQLAAGHAAEARTRLAALEKDARALLSGGR